MSSKKTPKKKILLLSDHFEMPSGVGTVSKQIIIGTLEHYDWVQLGATTQPQNHNPIQIHDYSEYYARTTGVGDANVKVYPFQGYGSTDFLRGMLNKEQPDAILHFTDPRYWQWLYEIAPEIRQRMPLMYYHVWDNLPDPLFNKHCYASCDWIGCISKQTFGIVNRVRQQNAMSDGLVCYVPHGIDRATYRPVDVPAEFRTKIFRDKTYDFVLYWSNRNMERKRPVDVMLAFQAFRNGLPEEKRNSVCLAMHCNPRATEGLNLSVVRQDLMPASNILFLPKHYSQKELNYLYNLADVTINIASNEGFGLTTCESLMAGTPVIVNVTGGLQDQCGFMWRDRAGYIGAGDYVKIGSLHDASAYKDKVAWGAWVNPVWPNLSAMIGSFDAPYIYNDLISIEDASAAIRSFYDMTRQERKARGVQGREYLLHEGFECQAMCRGIAQGIDATLHQWKPRK
ncbi:MAG: glycosyltransferase [Gammaproteobacteria bacterium]